MYPNTEVVLARNYSLVSIDWCGQSRSPQHISLQCPSLVETVFVMHSFPHQEEVSLHRRRVPGRQLQDVALFDELVGRVNNVFLLTQHLVYLQQFL